HQQYGKAKFPVTPEAKRVLDIKEEKKASKISENMFQEYLKTSSKNEREVLLCFGSNGFSEFKDVASALKGEISEAKARTIVNNLATKKMLLVKIVNTPLVPKF